MTTPAQDARPTVREVQSAHGPLVVEINSRLITIRPKGSRRGGPLQISVSAGAVYQHALDAAVQAKKTLRKLRRSS